MAREDSLWSFSVLLYILLCFLMIVISDLKMQAQGEWYIKFVLTLNFKIKFLLRTNSGALTLQVSEK